MSCREQKVLDTSESAFAGRRMDAKEQSAAADMVALLCVTLGRRCDDALESVTPALRTCCTEGKARTSCIAALAMGAFCAAGVLCCICLPPLLYVSTHVLWVFGALGSVSSKV